MKESLKKEIAFKQYRMQNEQILSELSKFDSLETKEEKYSLLNSIVNKIKAIKEENTRQKNIRQSFISTIAWHLSPNTRRVMKQNMTSSVKEILSKNGVVRKLYDEYRLGFYTKDELVEAIKELKLFCKEIRTDFRAGKPVEFDNYHTFYEEKEFDAWLEDDSFLGEFKKIAKDSKK